MQECNNTSECHEPTIIGEDNCAVFVYCNHCGNSARIGKTLKGDPENRLYTEWFKKDVLQEDVPLYYKYHGAKFIRIV